MKILITGATGFVGTNLQDYLKAYHKINKLSVRYLPDQKFVIETDALIHLAGKAHDLKKVSNPQDYYDANFELTKQLFDAFLDSDTKVFIFMSTVKAVADQVKGVLTEDIVANPLTHYGIAKYKAEQYILSKQLPYDKRVYILRPCMIHGNGNKGNLNLLYNLVSKGLPWPLGAFENMRSFLSIDNLSFVVNELLKNEKIPTGVYQISDNEPISTNELIKLLGLSLERKVWIWNVNANFVKFLSRYGDFLRLPLNSDRLEKLTENYIVSNEKIVTAMGKPMPIEVKEGLIKTFKSFKIN